MTTLLNFKENISYTGKTLVMVTETCCNCGVPFAITQEFRNRKLEQRETSSFYCPNGHPQHFVGESDANKAKRLQEERDRAKADAKRFADEALAAETKARHEREKRLKAQKRICNGVCTHCNRSFKDLHEHMKTKHPRTVARSKKS